MNKQKVLFVDDDTVFGNIIKVALEDAGYEIHYQSSLIAICAVLKEFNPDIIILDVEIGNDDGIHILPEIRLIAPETPIIFVSSHTEKDKQISALDAGAIVYLEKPFELDVLKAYIKRHTKLNNQSSIRIYIGELELDIQKRILYKDNDELGRLSQLEFALLKLLYGQKNKVVPYNQIEKIWENSIMSTHSLYNYIKKLKQSLSADKFLTINNIPGEGYMLSDKEA